MRDLRGRCTTRLRFRGNSLLGKVWESAECGWRNLPWRAAHDRRRQAATGGLYTRFPLALASKPLIINSLRSLLMVVWLCKPVLPSYYFFWSLIQTKWDVYIQHVRISVTSNMYVCMYSMSKQYHIINFKSCSRSQSILFQHLIQCQTQWINSCQHS